MKKNRIGFFSPEPEHQEIREIYSEVFDDPLCLSQREETQKYADKTEKTKDARQLRKLPTTGFYFKNAIPKQINTLFFCGTLKSMKWSVYQKSLETVALIGSSKLSTLKICMWVKKWLQSRYINESSPIVLDVKPTKNKLDHLMNKK